MASEVSEQQVDASVKKVLSELQAQPNVVLIVSPRAEVENVAL